MWSPRVGIVWEIDLCLGLVFSPDGDVAPRWTHLYQADRG